MSLNYNKTCLSPKTASWNLSVGLISPWVSNIRLWAFLLRVNIEKGLCNFIFFSEKVKKWSDMQKLCNKACKNTSDYMYTTRSKIYNYIISFQFLVYTSLLRDKTVHCFCWISSFHNIVYFIDKPVNNLSHLYSLFQILLFFSSNFM